MRYELKIALRYLRARRKEAFISITTIFTAVGVMIGVAALTITLAVMSGFEHSLKARVLSLTPQVQIQSAEGSITNYSALVDRALAIRGVSGADPYITGQGMLSSGRGIGGVVVRGVDPENPVVADEWGRYLVKGGFAQLSRGNTIVIGRDLADQLKVKLGDKVRLVVPLISGPNATLGTKTGDFTIGAIIDSGIDFLDSQLIFMNLHTAQDFFGRPGKADGIDVHLKNLDDTAAVTVAMREEISRPYYVRNWMELNQSAEAGFELLKRVYSLVLVLLIGVAAFNLVATLIMVVMEKRKDIAVLLSMGATRRDVRRIFVFKGLIVGAAGTAAGLIVGALGCFILARYHFIHISKQVYGISTVPISVNPVSFAWVAAASMLLCLLATFYPARQASREMPVEVFRT